MGPDGDSQKQVDGAKSRDDIIRAWDGGFIGQGKAFDDLWDAPGGGGGGAEARSPKGKRVDDLDNHMKLL